MPTPQFCTAEEVATLVYSFYAKVRKDEQLGPIFDAHISDWDHHLGTMVEFWSSILRGTASYHGSPMPKHVALPDLQPSLFHQWLALFKETTASLGNETMRQHADTMAERIAQSFWYGYQLYRDPDSSPSKLVVA